MEIFDIWDPEYSVASQPGRGSNSVFSRKGKFPVAAAVEMLIVEGQQNRLVLSGWNEEEVALNMTFLPCRAAF